MQFIFSSEVIFNLADCAQKKSWRYDKSVKKYSKKNTHPPPRLGEGGGKFKKTSQRGGGGYPQALIILEASNLGLKANDLWMEKCENEKKSPRSDWVLWTPDSNAHEALGYRLTFVRSEVSVTDSNSLMSDGRVHIVYKYVEGIGRLK